jgi:hypothetical protein
MTNDIGGHLRRYRDHRRWQAADQEPTRLGGGQPCRDGPEPVPQDHIAAEIITALVDIRREGEALIQAGGKAEAERVELAEG